MRRYTANQDIRYYMADRGVSQRELAKYMAVATNTVTTRLKEEMPQRLKEQYLNAIDAIYADRLQKTGGKVFHEDIPSNVDEVEVTETERTEETTEAGAADEVSCSTKFQIGDRVKIPSKANKIAIVEDIWSSLAKSVIMYAVKNEDDGYCGMYAENQLEPAPLPISYTFEAHIDTNVAVVTMIATQGDKTWVYARGHAHILHDGEVGMAQAISYAGKRMFESLDRKQDKQIYFKEG